MGRVLLAAFAGAIVCLIWGGVSWMVLDWHESSLRSFEDEPSMAAMLAEQAPAHGLYMLPRAPRTASNASAAEAQAAQRQLEKDRKAGPFAYAVVRPGPAEADLWQNLGQSFVRSLAACLVIALLLQQTSRLDYIQKTGYCTLCGLFAGLVTDVPQFIWFEFPLRATLVNMADHLCEWFLAGLVVSAIVRGREGY